MGEYSKNGCFPAKLKTKTGTSLQPGTPIRTGRKLENFLQNEALDFAVQGISQTYLVFTDNTLRNELVGYFALENKALQIKQGDVSKTQARRIRKSSSVFTDDTLELAVPLIAQLGKNLPAG